MQQDKSNTNSSVQSNKKQPDSLEKQKRRRTRKDSDAQREFKCECGKSYLSYPALYTHTKQKHNGQSLKNLDEQRQESTISESQTQDIFASLVNALSKEEKDQITTFTQINTQDIYDLIMWEIQLLMIESNNKEIKMGYYDELLKLKCPIDVLTPQDAFIKFINEVKEVLTFEQMKLVFLFVYCFRKLLLDFPDTTTNGLVEKANLLVCTQLDKVIQSIQQLSTRNYIVHLSRVSNLREAIIQIVLSFCNWLYARHLTDDKLLLKSDSD